MTPERLKYIRREHERDDLGSRSNAHVHRGELLDALAAVTAERDEKESEIRNYLAQLRVKHDVVKNWPGTELHRVVGNQEHDPENGKISGFCILCQVPWPCPYMPGTKAEPVLLAKLRCNQCNQEFDVALPSLTGELPQNALTALTAERDRYKAEAFSKHNAMMEAMTARETAQARAAELEAKLAAATAEPPIDILDELHRILSAHNIASRRSEYIGLATDLVGFMARVARQHQKQQWIAMEAAQARADEVETKLTVVTADRNEVERLFKESEHVREDLDAKWEAAQARADRLEGLMKLATDSAEKWEQRAKENGIQTDRLEQQLAHQSEHLSDCVTSESALSQDLDKACGRVRQAEAQLTTLKDKLRALPQIVMVSAKTNDEPQRIYVYIPKAELDALLAEPPVSAYTPLPV